MQSIRRNWWIRFCSIMEENSYCHIRSLGSIYNDHVGKIYLERNPDTAQGKIEVPVLDATAIGVSIFRGDLSTAGSVMFLLGIGELLEEWTHKNPSDDLARSMSLNVGKVWLKKEDQEVLVPSEKIEAGDEIVVHMGNVIPFDGEVVDGEAMVNQASLTGESVPVRRTTGNFVYAELLLRKAK